MFISLDLNRKNINRAISDNMLKDLGTYGLGFKGSQWVDIDTVGMNTNDYNYGQTVGSISSACSSSVDRLTDFSCFLSFRRAS